MALLIIRPEISNHNHCLSILIRLLLINPMIHCVWSLQVEELEAASLAALLVHSSHIPIHHQPPFLEPRLLQDSATCDVLWVCEGGDVTMAFVLYSLIKNLQEAWSEVTYLRDSRTS